jgi:hypothetical protein
MRPFNVSRQRPWIRPLATLTILLGSHAAHAQTYVTADQVPPGATVVYVDAYGRPIAAPQPPPPEAPPPPLRPARVVLGLSLSDFLVSDSAFNHTAQLWGYTGFQSGLEVALDGGARVTPWLLVGARVAYANLGGGSAFTDGAAMLLQTVDFDAIGRVVGTLRLGRTWIIAPAAQIELGGVVPWIALRGDSQSALLPRVGGTGILTFASSHVGISVRVGYRYADWGGAGGQGVDLSLAGVHAGLGLEVRL